MLRLANISNVREDLERFLDARDVRAFLQKTNMDGFELLLHGSGSTAILPRGTVCGVHLDYHPSWIPFWLGDEKRQRDNFGSLEAASLVMGAKSKEEFIANYRRQLDLAETHGALYAVFHVSESSLQETVSYRFHYTDEEVIDAALEVINAIFDGSRRSILFLTENLWWPGFSFSSPLMTARLIQGIQYKNKGIMLDIGHLMHTNLAVASYDDALTYIESMLDRHAELCRHIKGVHLHQTFSGPRVQEMVLKNIRLSGDYSRRLMQIYEEIMQIDAHQPFLHAGIARLINRIAPEYLVYEFITLSRDQHERFLMQQNEFLT